MTAAYAAYLDELDRIARAAAVAEEQFRKEAARRAEELRVERAFAYRRLNLLRAIGAAVAAANDEEDAARAGRTAFLREVGYSGATDAQRQVADRFAPVVLAVWRATRPDGGEADPPDVGDALAAFEAWYAQARNAAFLHLMEREVVELPLVEF